MLKCNAHKCKMKSRRKKIPYTQAKATAATKAKAKELKRIIKNIDKNYLGIILHWRWTAFCIYLNFSSLFHSAREFLKIWRKTTSFSSFESVNGKRHQCWRNYNTKYELKQAHSYKCMKKELHLCAHAHTHSPSKVHDENEKLKEKRELIGIESVIVVMRRKWARRIRTRHLFACDAKWEKRVYTLQMHSCTRVCVLLSLCVFGLCARFMGRKTPNETRERELEWELQKSQWQRLQVTNTYTTVLLQRMVETGMVALIATERKNERGIPN